MSEWIHSSRLPWRCRAEVWMRDGSVRKVETATTPMGIGLLFTDCTHPAQNVICDPGRVRAWRPLEESASVRN